MTSFFLFISGGEIIFVFLAVLLLFGSSKIPDLAKMVGKGMNEFRKATDDIKREFNDSTGGIVDDIKKSQQSINREIKDLGDSVKNPSSYSESIDDSDDYPSFDEEDEIIDLESEEDSKIKTVEPEADKPNTPKTE